MWEICNEPYFGSVTMDWQHRIADIIADAEKNFRRKHLITQNIANGRKKIENPHPAVSVFNFHYASPPDTFTAGHEDGTFSYPAKQPGGDNPAFRRQMKVLKGFLNSFDFVRMKPDKSFIKSGVASDARVSALAELGRQYALYFKGGSNASLTLDLPKGTYRVEWVCELTGDIEQREELKHAGGAAVLAPKKYTNEITLRILAAR